MPNLPGSGSAALPGAGAASGGGPFNNPNGLGGRIGKSGFLSHFRWYDPLLLAGTAGLWSVGIAGREGAEAVGNALKTDPVKLETPAAPPPAPDLTDAKIYEAGKAHAFSMGIGRNRRSTFLTGQSATSTMGQRKTLLGG